MQLEIELGYRDGLILIHKKLSRNEIIAGPSNLIHKKVRCLLLFFLFKVKKLNSWIHWFRYTVIETGGLQILTSFKKTNFFVLLRLLSILLWWVTLLRVPLWRISIFLVDTLVGEEHQQEVVIRVSIINYIWLVDR